MRKQLLFISVLIFWSIKLLAQTILGIDVSHYEGTINWTQVAASGKTFAWAKATEGVGYTDANYSTYMPAGTSAGVVMGAYHFARPENNSAVDEANYFLSVASSYIGAGKLPPALDLEDPPTGTALMSYFTSAVLTTWVQTWMTTVQNATGIRPVLYTSGGIAGYLSSSINTYGLWIANPNTSATTPPANIGVWNTWAFKQYSWTGTVSGISGSVDLDVFNGTVSDFNTLISGGTVVHNPPLCNNDSACNSVPSLTISSTCSGTSCSTVNATPPSPDIPYHGASACTSLYQSGRYDDDVWFTITPASINPVTITVTPTSNTSNFDVCIGLYTTTGCPTFTQVGCADLYSAGVAETLTFTPAVGTTYYIRVFSYGIGSSYVGNFDICATSICANPSAVSVSGGGTFCNSATITASGGTGGTIYWQGTTSGGTSATSASSSQVVTSSGTYYFRAENSCGWSTEGSATVTINSIPTQPGAISGSANVCQNSSQTYSVTPISGATGYTWSLPSGWTGTSNSNSITTTVGSSTGSISVTANNSCGSSAAQTLSVTVNPLPANVTASATPNPVCEGGNVTLSSSATGATSFSWTGPSGYTSSQQNSSVNNIQTNQAGVYTLTASNTCGSTSSGVTVTVDQIQPASVTISTSSTTVCANENVTFTAVPVAGGNSPTYAWYVNGILQGTTGSTFTLINAQSNMTIYCTMASSSTCASGSPATSNSINITVASQVTATVNITASPSTNICAGSAVTFTATPGNGGSAPLYQWLINNNPDGPNSSSNTYTSSVLNNGDVVSCVMTSNSACVANTMVNANQITMTVASTVTPAITVAASPAGAICAGTLVNFIAITTNGGGSPGYQWKLNGINVGNNSNYSSFSLANGDVVTCTLTSSLNCASPVTAVSNPLTLAVNPIPSAIVTPPGTSSMCSGDSIELSAPAGNPFYSWNTSAHTQSVYAKFAGTYSVTVTDINNCSAVSTPTTIMVNALPGVPTIARVNDTLTSSTAITYQWYLNNAAISGANNQTFLITQNGNYFVEITDANGCKNKSTVFDANNVGISPVALTGEIDLYPNPAKNELIVQGHLLSEMNPHFEIYDILGKQQIVSSKRDGDRTILDLESLRAGMYWLRLNFSGMQQSRKFVKVD